MRVFGQSKQQILDPKDLILYSILIHHPLNIRGNIHWKTDALLSQHPFFIDMEPFLALGYDAHESKMLADAFQAVTKADMWEYLRLPTTPGKDGFMFSAAIELAVINAEMKYQGHSGASYAWVMRQMEAIAKGGWTAYANRIRTVKAAQQLQHEVEVAKIRAERACPCRADKGFTSGWCGVAGGGVPACDH